MEKKFKICYNCKTCNDFNNIVCDHCKKSIVFDYLVTTTFQENKVYEQDNSFLMFFKKVKSLHKIIVPIYIFLLINLYIASLLFSSLSINLLTSNFVLVPFAGYLFCHPPGWLVLISGLQRRRHYTAADLEERYGETGGFFFTLVGHFLFLLALYNQAVAIFK